MFCRGQNAPKCDEDKDGSTDTAALLYLEDEKHRRRGVKGTIVEGDDGGAMSSE